MSLKRHVCRLPFHNNTPNDFVWISEDVLDSAISHFSHGRISRRHVGLAPGPLEARKRAAKRRMMNLAQVGGGEIDPSLLHGVGRAPGQASWQWQSPTVPAWKDARDTTAFPSSMGSTPPKAKDDKGTTSFPWPRSHEALIYAQNLLLGCAGLLNLTAMKRKYHRQKKKTPNAIFRE